MKVTVTIENRMIGVVEDIAEMLENIGDNLRTYGLEQNVSNGLVTLNGDVAAVWTVTLDGADLDGDPQVNDSSMMGISRDEIHD